MIGLDECGEMLLAHRIEWPEEMLRGKKDKEGSRFGNKSTTLEMVGLLLPFLLIPEVLRHQHVVLKVDNIACVYGWENKAVKGDSSASILIRSLHLINSYLTCYVHVSHLKRATTWESKMVDSMSRATTMTRQQEKLLASFQEYRAPSCFLDWIENPVKDWNLAFRLLNFVKQQIEKKI